MSAALQPPTMGRDDFFRRAERQPRRYEFDRFRPVAMTEASLRHDRMTARLRRELDRALAGKSCEPFGPNAGILTATNGVRYPDAVVTCSPVPDDLVRPLPNPVVVFEVVSPGTAAIDRIVKLREGAGPGQLLSPSELGIELPIHPIDDSIVTPSPDPGR